MARVLYDGLVEYEDGTAATTSQMAKDVVEFLNWAAEPEMDQRKKMGWATIIITSALLGLSIWVKRYVAICLRPHVFQKQVSTEWVPPDTNGHHSRQERLSTTLRQSLEVILISRSSSLDSTSSAFTASGDAVAISVALRKVSTSTVCGKDVYLAGTQWHHIKTKRVLPTLSLIEILCTSCDAHNETHTA